MISIDNLLQGSMMKSSPAELRSTALDGKTHRSEHPQAQKHYDDDSFWNNLNNFTQSTGGEVITTALKRYYALQDKDSPTVAKLASLAHWSTSPRPLTPCPTLYLEGILMIWAHGWARPGPSLDTSSKSIVTRPKQRWLASLALSGNRLMTR